MIVAPSLVELRLQKLKSLASHAWYRTVLDKLTESEFDLVIELIEDHGDLDRDAWTAKIQRLYLDRADKPKRLSLIQDVLMASREEAT